MSSPDQPSTADHQDGTGNNQVPPSILPNLHTTGLPLPENHAYASQWVRVEPTPPAEAEAPVNWALIRQLSEERIQKLVDERMRMERGQAQGKINQVVNQFRTTQTVLQNTQRKHNMIAGSITVSLADLHKKVNDYHETCSKAFNELSHHAGQDNERLVAVAEGMNQGIGLIRASLREAQHKLQTLQTAPVRQHPERGSLARTSLSSRGAAVPTNAPHSLQSPSPPNPITMQHFREPHLAQHGPVQQLRPLQTQVPQASAPSQSNGPPQPPRASDVLDYLLPNNTATAPQHATPPPQPPSNGFMPALNFVNLTEPGPVSSSQRQPVPIPSRGPTAPSAMPSQGPGIAFRRRSSLPAGNLQIPSQDFSHLPPSAPPQAMLPPPSPQPSASVTRLSARDQQAQNDLEKLYAVGADGRTLIPWNLFSDALKNALQQSFQPYAGWYRRLVATPGGDCFNSAHPYILHKKDGPAVACRDCAFNHRFCIKKWATGEIVVAPLCALDRQDLQPAFNTVEFFRLPGTVKGSRSKDAGVYGS